MLDFPPLSWYNFYMSRETVSETSNAEMVTIPRAEYEEMKSQINWLMEQLRVIKSKQFGSKSEKASEQVEEQLSLLFDEAEAWVTIEEKQAATKVKEHTRSRKSGNVRDILPENIEVVEVEHALLEEERACPQCGETMQPIGKEVQESLEFIPAKAILKRDIYYTYACENCKENDISTPIVKTPKDVALIPGSYASPEAVAYIAVQKFVMGSPLYRQE